MGHTHCIAVGPAGHVSRAAYWRSCSSCTGPNLLHPRGYSINRGTARSTGSSSDNSRLSSNGQLAPHSNTPGGASYSCLLSSGANRPDGSACRRTPNNVRTSRIRAEPSPPHVRMNCRRARVLRRPLASSVRTRPAYSWRSQFAEYVQALHRCSPTQSGTLSIYGSMGVYTVFMISVPAPAAEAAADVEGAVAESNPQTDMLSVAISPRLDGSNPPNADTPLSAYGANHLTASSIAA